MARAWDTGFKVEGDARLVTSIPGPQCLPIPQELVVDDVEFFTGVDQTGSMLTSTVAEVRHHPGLVEGQPIPYAIPEPGLNCRCIIAERVGRVPYPPPT